MRDQPAQSWTDDEIRKVGVAVARIYLEVERGLRNRDHLRRFMTPQAYSAQFADRLSRFPDAGPVRADDIGATQYRRVTHDRAMLTLIAREGGERWGAVCIDLQPGPARRWYVAELTRVQDRNLTHHHAPMVPGATPKRFRQRLLAERTAIETALAAARSRAAAAKNDLDNLRAADTADPGKASSSRRAAQRRAARGTAVATTIGRLPCRRSHSPSDPCWHQGRHPRARAVPQAAPGAHPTGPARPDPMGSRRRHHPGLPPRRRHHRRSHRLRTSTL